MKIHQLMHLEECVRDWGPSWSFSCFPFESMNSVLKDHFHGTKNMNRQVNNDRNVTFGLIGLFLLLFFQLAFSCTSLQLLPSFKSDANIHIFEKQRLIVITLFQGALIT